MIPQERALEVTGAAFDLSIEEAHITLYENTTVAQESLAQARTELTQGIHTDVARAAEDPKFRIILAQEPDYYSNGVAIGQKTELRVTDSSGYPDTEATYARHYKSVRTKAYLTFFRQAVKTENFSELFNFVIQSDDPSMAARLLSEMNWKRKDKPGYAFSMSNDIENAEDRRLARNDRIDGLQAIVKQQASTLRQQNLEKRIAESSHPRLRGVWQGIALSGRGSLKPTIEIGIKLPLRINARGPSLEKQLLLEAQAREF